MNLIAKFSGMLEAAQNENLALVKDGSLTIEEAAACLAGATIKAREELQGEQYTNVPQALHQGHLDDEYQLALGWLKSGI